MHMSISDKPDRGRGSCNRREVCAPALPKRRVASDDLLAGRDEVIIEHAGQEYHLHHTRAGKLILTK